MKLKRSPTTRRAHAGSPRRASRPPARRITVGMTYDLRDDYLAAGYGEEETAEFDRASTIEAVEQALRSLGYATVRIGRLHELVRRLAAGERWDIVFNIAEGLRGFAREAQVPALLDAYDIPYTFSDGLVLALTLHKGMTKSVVGDAGVPTPPFRVVSGDDDAGAIAGDDMPFPLFVKPVAEGTGKGVTAASRVTSRRALAAACRRTVARYRQPALVETFLPGREFTVGVIGTGSAARAVAVMEVILLKDADAAVYSYRNKEECEQLVRYRLADDAEGRLAARTALDAWRALGCRDAGRVDLRSDARGVPNFMEVNPLAGIHPEHSDLPILCTLAGVSYRELIAAIMESAMGRAGLPVPST